MKKYISILLGLILSLTVSAVAYAMSVTPVIVDMTSMGRKSRADLSVLNTGTSPIPVEVTVTEATIGNDGAITTKPADDLFQIYPMQAMVKPNETQKFRLRWIGDPEMEKGRTFIFSVAQQPVALPEGQSGIQLVYNFEVIVSVSPEKATPSLNILSSKIDTIEGKRRAVLEVNNTGIAHGYLSGSQVKLEAKDASGKSVWTKTIEAGEIGQNMGAGIMQPGARRTFTLPFDLPEGGENLSASLKYVGRQ